MAFLLQRRQSSSFQSVISENISGCDAEKIYGPDNFGDIMSNNVTNIYLDGPFSPLERVILMANGNLQRVLSAYFNLKITIDIKKSIRINENQYEREVYLVMNNETICIAAGSIEIYSEESKDAITNKNIGRIII